MSEVHTIRIILKPVFFSIVFPSIRMKWVVCLLSKRWWNFSIYWKLATLAEKKREWNEICVGKKRAMPSHWVLICRNHITIYQLKANYLEDSLGFSDLIDFLNHIKLFFSINFFNKMAKRNVYSLFMLCVYIFVIFKNWILSLINLFIIEHCFLKPISMWKREHITYRQAWDLLMCQQTVYDFAFATKTNI